MVAAPRAFFVSSRGSSRHVNHFGGAPSSMQMRPEDVVDLEAQVEAQRAAERKESAAEAKSQAAVDQARDMQERGILQEMRGDVHDQVRVVYVAFPLHTWSFHALLLESPAHQNDAHELGSRAWLSFSLHRSWLSCKMLILLALSLFSHVARTARAGRAKTTCRASSSTFRSTSSFCC